MKKIMVTIGGVKATVKESGEVVDGLHFTDFLERAVKNELSLVELVGSPIQRIQQLVEGKEFSYPFDMVVLTDKVEGLTVKMGDAKFIVSSGGEVIGDNYKRSILTRVIEGDSIYPLSASTPIDRVKEYASNIEAISNWKIEIIEEVEEVEEEIEKLTAFVGFSGGFGTAEFALKYLGVPHEIVGASEYDPFDKRQWAREAYLQNHGEPTLGLFGDIMKVDGTQMKGTVDFCHFSPPCQEYSTMGNQGGIESPRGMLSHEPVRLIGEIEPEFFIIENVANFAGAKFAKDMEGIKDDLTALGYQVSHHLMNAYDYGTPQSRNRVFIVGFKGEGERFNTPLKVPLTSSIGDLLEENVDKKYYITQEALDGFKVKTQEKTNSYSFKPTQKTGIIPTITKGYNGAITNPYVIDPKPTVVGEIGKGQSGRVYSLDNVACTLSAHGGGQGAKTGLYSLESGIRRLTPRECSRAMGDTEDLYNFDGFSDTRAYQFIGNAIDINTYKTLLAAMLKHRELIKPRTEPKITKKDLVQGELF